MKRGALNVTHVTLTITSVAVLGAWLLLRPDGTRSQGTPAVATLAAGRAEQVSNLEKALTNLTTEVAMLKREHEQLSRSLRSIEAAANRMASLSAPANTISQTEEDSETDGGGNNEWAEAQKITNTLNELDFQLDKEPDDPIWSYKTEMEIASHLHADVMEGSQVLNADCRSTLCRVEVAHEDTDAQQWLVDQLPMEPPFDGEMLIRRIDDGSSAPRTLVYVARPGHPLSAVAP